jgi:hypothetical protein
VIRAALKLSGIWPHRKEYRHKLALQRVGIWSLWMAAFGVQNGRSHDKAALRSTACDCFLAARHALLETPLLSLKLAEVSLSGSGYLVLHALTSHRVFLDLNQGRRQMRIALLRQYTPVSQEGQLTFEAIELFTLTTGLLVYGIYA